MNDTNALEIVIETKDEKIIQEVESELGSVNPQRWNDTRDLVTIIAIASSIVMLVKSLLELKEKFSKKPNAPKIVIYNINREAVDLLNASENTIKSLFEEVK